MVQIIIITTIRTKFHASDFEFVHYEVAKMHLLALLCLSIHLFAHATA